MSTSNTTDGEEQPQEHIFRVEHTGGRNASDGTYTFRVTGQITPKALANPQDTDHLDGGTVSGTVGMNGVDEWGFTGTPIYYYNEGNANAYIDGVKISMAEINSKEDSGQDKQKSDPVAKAKKWASDNPKKAIALGAVGLIAYDQQS